VGHCGGGRGLPAAVSRARRPRLRHHSGVPGTHGAGFCPRPRLFPHFNVDVDFYRFWLAPSLRAAPHDPSLHSALHFLIPLRNAPLPAALV
jgi:hypothetical protein